MRIFPLIRLSWHSGSTWDKPGWLNWFWQFFCDGLSSYHSYVCSGSLCEGGLHFARDLSLENSTRKFYKFLCFWLALLHWLSYFFFLHLSPPSSLCRVFDSSSSNIDEVLLINPSANVFLWNFNVKWRLANLFWWKWDLANFVIIFVSQMTLSRWLTFQLKF